MVMEDGIALSRPLPHQHHACGLRLRAVFGGVDRSAAEDALTDRTPARKNCIGWPFSDSRWV